MARPEPGSVVRAAVIGAGLIGGNWAALLLANGIEIAAYDPAAGAEAGLRARIEHAWPQLERAGLVKAGARPDRLRVCASPEDAAEGAEFVQESVPEDDAIKSEMIGRVDAVLDPAMVIASSASFYPPSRLVGRCRHPQRVIVGHPFNPSHLVPLVEIVPGPATDPGVMDWAMAHYAALGKRPVRLKKEIYGYIGNRLQLAIQREIMHLADEGIADIENIDAAMAYGPGLRWAIMGPCLVFHLTKEGGLAAIVDDMADFVNRAEMDYGPMTLDPATTARMVAETLAEARGRSPEAIAEVRDEAILALLAALKDKRPI